MTATVVPAPYHPGRGPTMRDGTSSNTTAGGRLNVSGVLLAAGASRRFGSAKMLTAIDGEPLVRRSARAYLEAGLDEVVVVLGSRADEIAAALAGLPLSLVLNGDWEDGMFCSVCAGIGAASPDAARIAVSPADLPAVTPAVVRRIVDASLGTDDATLTVPSHAGRRGHPLVIPGALRMRILTWPEDARLSDLFQEEDLSVRYVEGLGPEVLRDVDEPADLRAT